MSKRRYWMFAVVVGFTGCAGEDSTSPPVAAPLPTPAVKATSPAAAPTTPKETPAVPDAKKEEKAGSPKEPAAAKEAPALEAPKTGAAEEAPKPKLDDEQLAEIKKLPESEQAAAIKQAVCPVSDEPLGSMGMPVKVTAEGRTFYLCCDGCQESVKSDPKKVLAKLDKSK